MISICFGTLATYALCIMSLPISNADVERIFSQVNLIKTCGRNRISQPIPVILYTHTAMRCHADEDEKKCRCPSFQPCSARFIKTTVSTTTKNPRRQSYHQVPAPVQHPNGHHITNENMKVSIKPPRKSEYEDFWAVSFTEIIGPADWWPYLIRCLFWKKIEDILNVFWYARSVTLTV